MSFPLVPFHNIINFPQKHFSPSTPGSRYSYGPDLFSIPRSENIITDTLLHLAIKYYIKYHAAYLDYMSSVSIFQWIVPSLALSCPMLLQAAVACGAAAYECVCPNQKMFDKEQYYNEANSLLYAELQKKDRDIEACILTATLITIYEVSRGTDHDIKSHISGVKTLLEEFPFDIDEETQEIKFNSVIVHACFWIMIHCDLYSAFLLRSIPLWNPNAWGPAVGLRSNIKDSDRKASETNTPHYWYSQAIYVLYRITALRGLGYDPTLPSQVFSMRMYSQARQTLIDDLMRLQDDIPTIMKPMFEFPPFSAQNDANQSGQKSSTKPASADPESLSSTLHSHLAKESGTFSLPGSGNLFTKSSLHSVKSPFPFIYFSDPRYAITSAYITSGLLALNSMRTGTIKHTEFDISAKSGADQNGKSASQDTGIIASPLDPSRTVISSEDCKAYARRLTGIITSTAPNPVIGGMTVWCFLYVAPYIHDYAEREYILKYMEVNCSTGWCSDSIIAHLREEWSKPLK